MITTAHHIDDLEETILLKLLHGINITNIAGLLMEQRCTNYDNVVQDAISAANCTTKDDEEESSQIHLETNSKGKNEVVISGLYWVRPLLEQRLATLQHQVSEIRNHSSRTM